MDTMYKDEVSGCYYETKQDAIDQSIYENGDRLRELVQNKDMHAASSNELNERKNDIHKAMTALKDAYKGKFVSVYRKVKF